jgi:tetratricopeptide (TPR) repeat protein
MTRCCAVGAEELHASIAKALEEQIVRPPGEEAQVGESVAPLAYHWLRAEAWDKALDYTLEAAERARRLLARPEAINHYWQALELMERLPHAPERNRVHCDVILSLMSLPGWMRDEEAETRLFRHVDEALKNATEAGEIADVAKLEALKGRHQDDEALLRSSLVRAESSGDMSAEAFSASHYAFYLGQRGQFAKSLDYLERAIKIQGAQGHS